MAESYQTFYFHLRYLMFPSSYGWNVAGILLISALTANKRNVSERNLNLFCTTFNILTESRCSYAVVNKGTFVLHHSLYTGKYLGHKSVVPCTRTSPLAKFSYVDFRHTVSSLYVLIPVSATTLSTRKGSTGSHRTAEKG